MVTDPGQHRVREVALLFLKLGTIAFGGPAAHTAMMRDEVVRRRGWVTDQRFVDLMGATNLIPGPNSTELAIHLGYDRARWRGLLTAGVCFILPAALMVTGLAWAYVEYGETPALKGVLYGIVPVVIAIITHALVGLSRTVLKNAWLVGLSALALTAYFLGVSELVLLAFLRGDFVERLGWITEQQLIDAVSVGQVTPGPVFTTATFLGWVIAGPLGAFLATAAIFTPSFLFVGLLTRLTDWLRSSAWTSALLDAVNATALALMAGVSVQLGREAIVDPLTVVIAVVTLVLLWRTRLNSAWFIGAGALIGLVATLT